MPTRNANSVAAARLLVPASNATKIVAADREVPGNTPATICAMPTRIATAQVIVLRSPSTAARLAAKYSAAIIQTPPSTSAHAIGVTVSGNSKPSFLTSTPSTAVMTNAAASLYA